MGDVKDILNLPRSAEKEKKTPAKREKKPGK
jgi:hypothetical protein